MGESTEYDCLARLEMLVVRATGICPTDGFRSPRASGARLTALDVSRSGVDRSRYLLAPRSGAAEMGGVEEFVKLVDT
jgi:hypothetical protein